jgi:leucyl-tRNA synthetase
MVAALMELSNHLSRVKDGGTVPAEAWNGAMEALMVMLAPTAPHMTEELWQLTGHGYSIHNQKWPEWDEELAREDEITLVVQVNGKVRHKLTLPASVSKRDAEKAALDNEKIQGYTGGRDIAKIIYVPGKLINVVVKQ